MGVREGKEMGVRNDERMSEMTAEGFECAAGRTTGRLGKLGSMDVCYVCEWPGNE